MFKGWKAWSISRYRHAAFRYLNTMNDDLFSCLLQSNYPNHVYLYERRLHLQKIKFLEAVARLKQHGAEIDHLMRLFDCLQDCCQIRYRVTDHSTFDVCARELTQINIAIRDVLNALRRENNDAMLSNRLLLAIDQLEDVYQHVLQVAAKEPLVFVLFIYALKGLYDQMV